VHRAGNRFRLWRRLMFAKLQLINKTMPKVFSAEEGAEDLDVKYGTL